MFVTHVEQVRAEIRVAWPAGIDCPPRLVRWRAGSAPTDWHTLIELARVKAAHPGEPLIESLTCSVALELIAQNGTHAGPEVTKYLIAGTLAVVAGLDEAQVSTVDEYLSGAA